MRGPGSLADRGEQPVDIGMAQYLGQSPLRTGAGQDRRRIVGPQPFFMQKGIKAPERRRLARNGGVGQLRPAIGQPAQRIGIGIGQPAHRVPRQPQVGAIGGQRIARRARLGRHHLQKAIEQRAVANRHARAMASAAIIRASVIHADRAQRFQMR